MRSLRPDLLAQHIAALLVSYPELAEDDALKIDTIEGETDALMVIDRIIEAIEDTKILIGGLEALMKSWIERGARFERRLEGLKEGIRKIMEAAEINKLERPTATMYFVKGQPKLIDTTGSNYDLKAHPHLGADYIRTYHEISKSDVRKALMSGAQIEGFGLSNAEPALHIKHK